MQGPKKLKILYVVTKSVWGGAQRYVFDLAVNLPTSRFEAVVAAGGSGPLMERLKTRGIRTIEIPGFARDIDFFREITSLWKLYRIFLRERPDIIHLNSSKAGGIGAVAAWLYQLSIADFSPKVIFTAHGWGFYEKRSRFFRSIIKLATIAGAIFQDKIIVIDTLDLQAARSLFFAGTKAILIYNGIGELKFHSREEARDFFAKKIGTILDSGFLIGSIAELTANKGLDFLIEALRELDAKERKLYVIIIGEGEDRKKLEKKIRDYGLGDMVFLPGFIPNAAKLLKAFDLFVFPSLKEGLPYALLEAARAGIPIVATRVGGIPDIVDGTNGIVVTPQNPREIAYAIKDSFSTPRTPAASNKFTLIDMVQKTLHTYIS